MSTTQNTTRHDAVEVCQNTDRSLNLADTFDDVDVACARLDHPGTDFCGLCDSRFDDPRHGVAARCHRKTAHVCLFMEVASA